MASFRRTISPHHHDRSYLHSPNHKLFSDSTTQYSSATNSIPRLVAVAVFQKRKFFRRYFCRFVLFFALGFFLGLLPFGHLDFELRNRHDFSIEANRDHVNVQLDESNAVIKKRHEEDLGINVVSLGVNLEKPNPYISFNNNDHNSNEDVVSRKLDFSNDDTDGVISTRMNDDDDAVLKQLIIVTPTYNRGMQGYFLRRLGNVLKLVSPPLLWMVVEMGAATGETAELLRWSGVTYRHLVCVRNSTEVKDRGVHQRNVALEHIERHQLDGIVYFADDDNVYSIELFERLRDISRFGTWPVAMLAQGKNRAILEGPICNGSQVIGWHTNEKSKRLRRFHVDMSGFAFNSTILWDSKRWNRPFSTPIRQLDTVKEGFQETTFIEQIVEDERQMEGIPSGCSKIMNWHLHLEAPGLAYPRGWIMQKNLEVVIPIS